MRATETVFISHAHSDQGFTEFIAELLNAHDLNPWHSGASLESGIKYPEKIESSIINSSAMVVIASSRAISSKWMTREITLFRTHKEKLPIIPIKIDDINLDEIYDGLSQYQHIDFRNNPTVGLKKALQALNRNLFQFDAKRVSERRAKDRRVNPPEIKLRDGLLIAFSKVTELGKYESFDPNFIFRRKRMDLVSSIHVEIGRYNLLSAEKTERKISFSEMEKLITETWEEINNKGYNMTPILFAEEIVAKIKHSFSISPKERRAQKQEDHAPETKIVT